MATSPCLPAFGGTGEAERIINYYMKKVEIEALNPIHGNVNYLSELRQLARRNRANPTDTEKRIWQIILRDEKMGYKFTRQKPINRFIVDFYCSTLNLAIEIDGGSHIKKKDYDFARDRFLSQIGIKTIRFTNDQIIKDIEKVRDKIFEFCSVSPVKGR